MKNFLLYNYGINVDNLNKISDSIISFYIDYDKYYLIETKQRKDDIIEIYNYLKANNTNYHDIILNKNNEIFSLNKKRTYILIKIKGPENREIDLMELFNKSIVANKSLSHLDHSNWANLWSEKIDYLEYQVSELGKNHPLVVDSFSYYIGLAENAIEYYNMLVIKDAPKVLSAKRIIYPNFSKNFYNPLNIIIDYRVRNVAEYIKSQFFSQNTNEKEVLIFLSKNYFSIPEKNLLFARLLYPTYYFDAITKILEKQENDDILLKYILRVNDYEVFLKKIITVLSKESEMIKVDWIIKKEDN